VPCPLPSIKAARSASTRWSSFHPNNSTMADPQYKTLQVGERTKTRVSESSEKRVSDQRLRLVNSKDWAGGLDDVDMEG